jgi:hypothetical protein
MATKSTKKSAKKTASKKSAPKTAAKKTIKKSIDAKPLPANREPAAKRLPAAPSGHGVAKLEIKPERVAEILKILHATYPDVECALVHANPWQLLVATILSAQCTDVRVNMVTPKLFATYPTPKAMAKPPSKPWKNSSAPPASTTTRQSPSKAQAASSASSSTAKSRKPWLNCSPSPAQPAKPPTSF